MSLIHLQGQLICTTPEDRRVVLSGLAAHLRQSLGHPGCLFYEITQTEDPFVWQLDAGFADRHAFTAWQQATETSEWASRGIRHDLTPRPAKPEIGPETAADPRALHQLLEAAFARRAEADLVDALRASGDLALSLTARFGRACLGHCAFSALAAPFPAWALGPLATRASLRRQGIATTLVQAGLEIARARGIAAIFVLGDPAWYHRFGFSAEAARGFISPHAGPHLQLLNLTGTALPKGEIRHAAAFADLDD
ncbi:N-acetyltransferase [Rhodobacter capsulatus]|uniref:N-acetyltransferase n=1 Tax=Rhodobacter capsulatus TaxID=1061 RepID=A0A4U1JSP1_RHOCA|nr:N-acetyltransferase [Rhodobacter capsulatus]TKD22237.1 N-acetyltransferase [Rhodobacter capsulatus]